MCPTMGIRAAYGIRHSRSSEHSTGSGNPERVALIEGLQRGYSIAVGSGGYRELFNRSLMVLNQSAANDVNFRTFQAMACGALLVGERIGNGFDDLFQDRTHCALYEKGNVEQVIEIVAHYCGRPAERDAVARQGYEAVMASHTSLHRAQAILQVGGDGAASRPDSGSPFAAPPDSIVARPGI
jgi:hypothetical protein